MLYLTFIFKPARQDIHFSRTKACLFGTRSRCTTQVATPTCHCLY